MSTDISVLSRSQIIIVEPTSKAVSVINAGPPGSSGPGGGGFSLPFSNNDTNTILEITQELGDGSSKFALTSDTESDLQAGYIATLDTLNEDAFSQLFVRHPNSGSPIGTSLILADEFSSATLTLQREDSVWPVFRANSANGFSLFTVYSGENNSGNAVLTVRDESGIEAFDFCTNANVFRIHKHTSQGSINLTEWRDSVGTKLAITPRFEIEMSEGAGPGGAAATDKAILYLRDNGFGKTQLVVQYQSGSPIVINTEL